MLKEKLLIKSNGQWELEKAKRPYEINAHNRTKRKPLDSDGLSVQFKEHNEKGYSTYNVYHKDHGDKSIGETYHTADGSVDLHLHDESHDLGDVHADKNGYKRLRELTTKAHKLQASKKPPKEIH